MSVEVPDELAGPLARLIERSLRDVARANGAGGMLSPELLVLLRELAAADLRHLDDTEPAVTSATGSDDAGSGIVLSVEACADRLGCSRRWIRHLISTGRLAAERVGQRAWSVRETDLEEYLQQRRTA